MSNKIDDYNTVVNIIEKIIRATSDSHEKEDLDKTFDIAHGIGKALEVMTDDQKKKR